jgi:undecaprenyl-diphosphatase
MRAQLKTEPAAIAGQANVGWLLIALLGLVGFVLLTVVVASKVVIPYDQSLLDLARSWNGYPDVWHAISESANIPLIVIGFGMIIWLFWKKRHREAVLVLLVLAAVTAGSEGVKQLTGRPRPSGTGDGIPGVVYSYPSGHVLEALTILGILAVRTWRSSRPLALRLALAIVVTIDVVLVGVARLALNAHYPSDILAGLLGGMGALGLYAWLTRPGAWADQPAGDSHEARDTRQGS